MRKKIERIIGIFIIALAIIFAVVYFYLSIMGKGILTNKLREITRKEVTIGSFSLTPTLRVNIKELNIQGLVKSQIVSATPSILGLFKGRLVLNQLTFVQPEFFINKTPPEIIEAPSSTVVIVPPVESSPIPKVAEQIPFGIARLNIKDGKLTFIDQTVKPGSIKIIVQDIQASVRNFYLYPTSSIIEFKLNSVIPWREGEEEGKVELEGWINSFKKDMKAAFKIEDIDAVYLYPYYSTWVDLDKARIERAKLNFSGEIHGLNNNVTADCQLELSDMVRKPLEIGESEAKASKLTNAVLDRFKAQDNGSVKLNFTIKTKMDSPQFGFENFKSAFEEKLMKGRSTSRFSLQDAMAIPAKTVESGVKSFTDLSRAMIDGLFTIGNETKRSTEDMFNRENNSQSTED